MTPSKQIEELIGRLEKANGPDWELDIEIGEIFFPEQYKALCEVFEKTWKRAQENGLHDRRLACWRGTFQGVWRFTYSIDAALTLVPEGWRAGLDPIFFDDPKKARTDAILCRPDYAKWNPVNSEWIEHIEARGSTPAIALCIASLRARLAISSKEEA